MKMFSSKNIVNLKFETDMDICWLFLMYRGYKK